MSYPIISDDPGEQARYEAMRDSGQSHNMAEMLACRAVPGIRTDSTFMRGSHVAPVNPKIREVARKAGVVTDGKKYLGQLARYEGDPQAWVSGRGDIQRVCERNGWGCEGAVSVKAPPLEGIKRDGPYRPADDIVQAAMDREIAKDPGLASTPQKRAELFEATRERISPTEGGM
jgi:hypothetical protein